ncbi:MAG: hypothetical protein A3J30_02805 [Candidatus Wildermuthbacteria bacterium RIFCSPLOWO2_02_FULL_47_9c]|uniref:Uncharacterized protein n=1 Tax=Candidatus Wildermuthbacteria bacterium RIFCSPLOWO2_02_FULL_47_9c TaxID=1802466 RepID=A0A1G2RYC2_9BACT|nr:MAG: hypothetical protein A2109_00385 [Candidatus Wildermuthbacteria bacterium GWA1_49_26]OHA69580.1 MAG: hypothetical protein A3D63_03225 [Candidatus Wildermuthbacteria bacterium RIFCSPHIGHO2_02_FULL_49_17]OHA74743.1 MAG: hypothetical protein A3B28_00705 [Candidatus Wildermuthbacteria bacterium RIFCSPLOWO2_01_FULL_50_46]OHA77746.1 MAG: hypothetical protein A3G10_02210 [Candidatus Wildermuthbacteria bacterium RIFCSPLOWO2_12_FULL_49_9]OHA77837.1 MAG: hypothetical protein A3J30_02805 [Candidat
MIVVLYIENSSNAFRRLRRRKQAPVICGSPAGLAAFFDNFKFFYELIITHCSKFFKKNELEKFTALAANSLALLQKEQWARIKFSCPLLCKHLVCLRHY